MYVNDLLLVDLVEIPRGSVCDSKNRKVSGEK